MMMTGSVMVESVVVRSRYHPHLLPHHHAVQSLDVHLTPRRLLGVYLSTRPLSASTYTRLSLRTTERRAHGTISTEPQMTMQPHTADHPTATEE